MKSLIKKRREQRALCPKCLSPDYCGLAPEGMYPDRNYFYDADYIFGVGAEPYWHFVAIRNKINLKPKPLWQCRSCGYLFQTDINSVHQKLSHFNEMIERGRQ